MIFSWCDYEQGLRFIQATLNGEDNSNDWAGEVPGGWHRLFAGRCGEAVGGTCKPFPGQQPGPPTPTPDPVWFYLAGVAVMLLRMACAVADAK